MTERNFEVIDTVENDSKIQANVMENNISEPQDVYSLTVLELMKQILIHEPLSPRGIQQLNVMIKTMEQFENVGSILSGFLF